MIRQCASWIGLAALALAGCATVDDEPAPIPLEPALRFQASTMTAGPDPALLEPRPVPADFTGCLAAGGCYIRGEFSRASERFEPHTGRFWFLDPATGNTYYANGDLRTGDPFQARRFLID